MSEERGGHPFDEVEVELGNASGDVASGSSPIAPPGEVTGGATRPDRRGIAFRWRLARSGAIVVALGLIVVGLIRQIVPAAPALPVRPTPTPAAAFLPPDGLGCVEGAAWDPTSAYIALVGPPDSLCGGSGYDPNLVNIYRARTGTLVRQLRPDPAVFAALGMPVPASLTPVPQSAPRYPTLSYDSPLWSPDGRQLALSFNLSTATSPYQAAGGLVVLAADGSGERVLVDRGTGPPPNYTVWDLHTGMPMYVGNYPLTGPPGPLNTLPPALAYGWSGNGTLVPGAPLRASTPPPLAFDQVGNPDGGQTFGLWQPGQIQVYAIVVSGQENPVDLYVFQTAFAAWSPDGRYVVDHLSFGGLLVGPGQPMPSQAVLSAARLDGAAVLPVRDAGLEQALAHDAPQPVSLGTSGVPEFVPMAWRPDGKAVALLTLGNDYVIRAAATGRVVKTAPLIAVPPSSVTPPGQYASFNAPLWSPDGNWLLLPSLALVRVGPLKV